MKMTNQNTITLYTCLSGQELYSENKDFYAETAILDSVDTEVYEVEVDKVGYMVELQIQYETDGVKVYKIKPEQVLSIVKLS